MSRILARSFAAILLTMSMADSVEAQQVWHDPQSPGVIYPMHPKGQPIYPGLPVPTNRPMAEPDLRERQIHDPAMTQAPRKLFLRWTCSEGTSFRFFSAGNEIKQANAALIAVRPRARYAFALQIEEDSKVRYYGTIDVIRGPNFPPDVKSEEAVIPIAFDEEDLVQLLRDRMLTKFIVLENPAKALDYASDPERPLRYEASFEEDAARRAMELGKIMMVVRIGNRVPTEEELAKAGGVGAMLISRGIEIVDAQGEHRVVHAEFCPAETYPNGPITQVHFTRRKKGEGDCVDGHCSAEDSSGTSPSCEAPSGHATGVDLARLLNNDATYGYEYICDGGDRRPRVGWRRGGIVAGVDPEDTIAEYQTSGGGKRFAVSNRVCLFAPRYIEIRVLQKLDEYQSSLGFATVNEDRKPVIAVGKHPSLLKASYQGPGLVRTDKRPRGLEGRQWSSVFLEARVLGGFEQGLGWAQTIGLFGPDEKTGVVQPWLANRISFARTLTLDLAPQLVGMVAGTGEVRVYWKTHEIKHIDQRDAPDVLKIEKTADRDAANVGDVVEFAIRYTNVGKQAVSNIAIHDSLVSRLEYVEESADSNRPAVFTAKTNEAGSTELRWEIKDPLPPKESGVVRFRAKLR